MLYLLRAQNHSGTALTAIINIIYFCVECKKIITFKYIHIAADTLKSKPEILACVP